MKEWWKQISFLWRWKAACKNESRNASIHQKLYIQLAEKFEKRITVLENRQDPDIYN